MKNKFLVGVDFGGTKILAGVVDEDGNILARSSSLTKAVEGVDAVIKRIENTILNVLKEANLTLENIKGVGIGAPGPLNPKEGIIIRAPNLPGFNNTPIAKILSESLNNIPVFIENDVNTGTLGETDLGVARGAKHVIGVFPGTGIGGGVIVNGKLVCGATPSTGEIGHVPVTAEGPWCGCGNRGCLEAYAGRLAIVRDIRAACEIGKECCIPEMINNKWDELRTEYLFDAWNQNDEVVMDIMNRAMYYTGMVLGGLINVLSPEYVVFGGGTAEVFGDVYLKHVTEATRKHSFPHMFEKTKFAICTLGDDVVLAGGAALVARRLNGG